MPEAKKPVPEPKQPQPPAKPVPEQPKPAESPKPEQKPAKAPEIKTKKDDTLKYEFKYISGGFNNGVEILPTKDSKFELVISIYGGGTNKKILVKPSSKNVQKMIDAYRISIETGERSDEVLSALKDYIAIANKQISYEIMKLFEEVDTKIEDIIKRSFKSDII